MKINLLNKKLNGQSLIELLLAIAFSGIILPVLILSFLSTREGKAQQLQRTEAVSYATEASEAIRVIREASWGLVSANGIYHPVATASGWVLAPGTENISGFSRSITISDVYRDSEGQIVESGGTLDLATKKIVVNVSWTDPNSSSISRTFYLSRYLGNASQIHTTKLQFDQGIATGSVTTNLDGGEVVLAAGGRGDWCAPSLVISAVDLPKNGVANAVSAVEGNVVAGTGENSSGISFGSVGINNNNPPNATLAGTFDGYKTNGVFTDGNYAYVATDNNSKEVVILDLSTTSGGKYSEVGYFDAPGNTDGVSVSVATGAADIGFVTTANNKLYTFNLTVKTGSRAQLGTKDLAALGTKVVTNSGYAYVSIAGATQEMQIVQFNSSGTTLTITGYADVNGQGASDVTITSSGSRAYLSTAVDASRREFFVIDTSSKTGSRPIIGSYDSSGMDPKGVSIASGNRAIIVGSGAEEYQVINISNEANPVRCGGLQINSGVNGIATVFEYDGDAYSYIITGDASSELKLIEGGAGGQYVQSGTYTSSVIDAGATRSFNRISANVDLPSNTTAQFQVAIASSVSGSCNGASYVFVGPDGTSNTYFLSVGGVIPFDQNGSGYENPGRCMRYRAYLTTTDINLSPVIRDVTINYSP